MKTFTAVGIVNKDGQYKMRWSNDPGYCCNQFSIKGETEIVMAGLSQGLSKRDGVLFLHDKPEFQSEAHQTVINNYLTKYPA